MKIDRRGISPVAGAFAPVTGLWARILRDHMNEVHACWRAAIDRYSRSSDLELSKALESLENLENLGIKVPRFNPQFGSWTH